MSFKKIMLLVIALSFVMSLTVAASAASKAKPAATPAAQTANADSVGVVDRGEILNNHPGLAAARQKLADIARQKENEAKAAADIQIMNVNTDALILSLSESVRTAQKDSSINLLGIAGGKAQVDGMESAAVAELTSILSIKTRGVVTGEFPTVTDVSRKEIKFNIGTTLGAKKNGFYRVYTVEHGYEENIAVVKVKRADAYSSTANIAGKKRGRISSIRPGDRVAPITAKDIKPLAKEKAFVKSR